MVNVLVHMSAVICFAHVEINWCSRRVRRTTDSRPVADTASRDKTKGDVIKSLFARSQHIGAITLILILTPRCGVIVAKNRQEAVKRQTDHQVTLHHPFEWRLAGEVGEGE